MKVGIRADGGPDRGIGHLVRSSVLANKFLEEGYEVIYLTVTPETVAEICPSSIGVYSLSAEQPLKDTVAWIEQSDTEIVVSDCYDVDTAAQEAISAVTDCFVVIQVDNRYELHCDLLVNGHLFGPDVEYQWQGTEPVWCVGTDYLLLRSEFREFAKQSPEWRVPAQKALITMGGSDVTNTTPTAMHAFDGLDIEVDVIIGPGYDNREEISNVASNVSCRFNLVDTPADLPARMADADLAVSGFGTTSYELLATKTPFVGIPVVENQEKTARAFERRALAEVVENEDELEQGVHKLFENSNHRRTLLERYDSLIDGYGAERVFAEIESLASTSN